MANENKTLTLVNTSGVETALAVIPEDLRSANLPPSEALIRAREAVIAGQYVTGLDAENQVRAGQHDDWLPLQICYAALTTKDIDIDILRKYHASGQMSLALAERRPIVQRPRRSPWNIMCVKVARWFDVRRHNQSPIVNIHKQQITAANTVQAKLDRLRAEHKAAIATQRQKILGRKEFKHEQHWN